MSDSEYDENAEMTKYYDRHTLYVFTYEASLSDISRVIENAINQVGLNHVCHYKINLIKSRDGIQYAFIRVSDETVYYALIGRNKDGSERFELIDDPDFVMPQTPLEEALKKIKDDDDWDDATSQEKEIRARYVPRKVESPLPPLITLIPYDDNENYLKIMRAFVTDKDDPYVNNVLFTTVPDWVTYQMLSPYFTPYVTDRKEKRQTKNGPKSYPLIMFKPLNNDKKGKKVYITYSPASHDAHFCLLMNRIIHLEHDGQKRTIYLDHFKSFAE